MFMKKTLALGGAASTALLSSTAFAQSAAAANEFDVKSMAAIGAGLAIGLAALGGGPVPVAELSLGVELLRWW